ncbi:STAS domain-containing protein [Umezawaea endophytica]|uniref:Anti-sigma factor antagonist n=1 Tax=Umezawaea endophytica TaxID=1654476 RepID=A0A9X2VIS5_9PSEU|nr:STAS domain-containing protein [Umezawaea endophytica]MCS7477415.1 STAS domain-containing protein [Umezawaea endophytica]
MRTVPGQDSDADLPRLRVHHQEARGAVVVAVVGDVDMNTVPELEDRLVAVGRPEVPLVLDLTGVTFLDSTGLSALVRCHQRGLGGGGFRLVVASRAVARPLSLTALDGLLDIYPTVDAALAA